MASPLTPNQTGVRYFCSFADAVVRYSGAAICDLRRHRNPAAVSLDLAKYLGEGTSRKESRGEILCFFYFATAV